MGSERIKEAFLKSKKRRMEEQELMFNTRR